MTTFQTLSRDLFCLTLSHVIDDPVAVESFLIEYPERTEGCMAMALHQALAPDDPSFHPETDRMVKYLSLLWDKSIGPTGKLQDAARYGLVHALPYLIAKGVYTMANYNDALIIAVRHNQYEMVEKLLDIGADVEFNGNQAILTASSNGSTRIMKLLIDRGANVHVNNDNALLLAALYGSVDAVRLLIAHGAKFNMRDYHRLGYLTNQGMHSIVKLLRSTM